MNPTLSDLLTYETITVIIVSVVTGVVSLALMVMVFLQGPRQAVNQVFVLLTLILAVYSVTNVFSRFVMLTNLNPTNVFKVTSVLYVWVLAIVYIFCNVFGAQTGFFLPRLGVAYTVLFSIGVVNDWFFLPARPAPNDVGGFITTYTPLGFAGLGIAFAFLFSALYRLWRSPAEGARVVFPAVAVLMVGGVAVALRPLSTVVPETFAPLFTFPYNATMMGVAVLILGRAVLQKQLFDPLRRLNRQLIETNQRLAHAQRHKTLFLTNMSHELRTPLSAIIGYNDLLLNGIYGELSPKQIDRLERVKANAQHLLALINDVLDLSKIEAGSLKLYPQTLDASELLDALCERYAKSAREKNLAFSLQTEGDLKLEADKARLEQILNNLLSNALKFTPQGEVTLYAVGENRQVRFEVQDTGIGIPPQALPFIFDVFRQVDDATTRQHEGTGAGLALCQNLVRLHGGELRVESQVGVGSRFIVCLPRQNQPT